MVQYILLVFIVFFSLQGQAASYDQTPPDGKPTAPIGLSQFWPLPVEEKPAGSSHAMPVRSDQRIIEEYYEYSLGFVRNANLLVVFEGIFAMPFFANHPSTTLAVGGMVVVDPALRVLGDEYAKYRRMIPYLEPLKTVWRCATMGCLTFSIGDVFKEESKGLGKWGLIMLGLDILESNLAEYRDLSTSTWRNFNNFMQRQNMNFIWVVCVIISMDLLDYCLFSHKS